MASITRKRKNELLQRYYDGDTVGRAAVNRYLDTQKVTFSSKHKPEITAEELIFLRENLTEKDKEIYKGYAKLTETFGIIGQATWGWGEAFAHSFYQTLYYIEPAASILCAFSQDKSIYNINLEHACSNRFNFIKMDMPTVWEMVKRSIIFLYRYNLIMQALGETCNFDIDFLCYDLFQLEIDFNSLMSAILMLRQAISSYKAQQDENVTPKTKIIIPNEVEKLLENITKVRIDDLKPTQEVKNSLLELFSQVPSVFPSVINCNFLDRIVRNELLSSI